MGMLARKNSTGEFREGMKIKITRPNSRFEKAAHRGRVFKIKQICDGLLWVYTSPFTLYMTGFAPEEVEKVKRKMEKDAEYAP